MIKNNHLKLFLTTCLLLINFAIYANNKVNTVLRQRNLTAAEPGDKYMVPAGMIKFGEELLDLNYKGKNIKKNISENWEYAKNVTINLQSGLFVISNNKEVELILKQTFPLNTVFSFVVTSGQNFIVNLNQYQIAFNLKFKDEIPKLPEKTASGTIMPEGLAGEINLFSKKEKVYKKIITTKIKGNYSYCFPWTRMKIMVAASSEQMQVWLNDCLLISQKDPNLSEELKISLLRKSKKGVPAFRLNRLQVYQIKSLPTVHKISPSKIATSLRNGIASYLSFDNNFNSKGNLGFRTLKKPQYFKFKDSPWSKGIELGVTPVKIGVKQFGVSQKFYKVFNKMRGSIAFWVKPYFAGKSKTTRLFLNAPGSNFDIWCPAPFGTCFFRTGGVVKNKGFRWSSNCTGNGHDSIVDWLPNEWHHIAITWDKEKGTKNLYLDGWKRSSEKTWIMPKYFAKIELAPKDTPGLYDEWTIWNRVLEPREVTLLARNSQVAKQALLQQEDQLYEKEVWPISCPVFRPKKPVENIILSGEVFTAQIKIKNQLEHSANFNFTFKLIDFYEKVRGESLNKVVKLAKNEKIILKIPFKAPENGIFKISISFEFSGKKFERDIASFVAFPKYKPVSKETFFGDHINSWNDYLIEQAAMMGLRWNRNQDMLQGTWWAKSQPEPGDFKWSYDYQIQNNLSFDMHILGAFNTIPYWADLKGKAKKIANIDAYPHFGASKSGLFAIYVRETVKKYKKHINYWEVGNEPHTSRFSFGTPEVFAKYVNIAAKISKEADPDAKIITYGFDMDEFPWYEKAAKAGLLKNVDAVSFHRYIPEGTPENIYNETLKIVNKFKRYVKKYGPGHPLPLWNTEAGDYTTTWLKNVDFPKLPPQKYRMTPNWKEAALRIIKNSAIEQSMGIKKNFFYLSDSNYHYANLSMIDITDAPKPLYFTRNIMIHQIGNKEFVKLIRYPKNKFWAFIYENKEKSEAVVLWWSDRVENIKIIVLWPGEITEYVDILGNSVKPISREFKITAEPAYLHIKASAFALEQTLKKANISHFKTRSSKL